MHLVVVANGRFMASVLPTGLALIEQELCEGLPTPKAWELKLFTPGYVFLFCFVFSLFS